MDYTLVIEKSEDQGFIGSVVELPGCYTQADTIDQLIANIKEAIQIYIETEHPEHMTEFVGIQKISL